MNICRRQFGPVVMEYHMVLERFCPEIAWLPEAQLQRPDLILQIDKHLPQFKPTLFVGKQSIAFNADTYRVNTLNDWEYLVEGAFLHDRPIKVTLRAKTIGRKTQITRAIGKGIQYIEAFLLDVKNVCAPSSIGSYSLLWYLMHLALWKKGATFAHGAAWSQDNRGTVLLGSGGCGKTSTLLALKKRNLAKYLAEDFVVIHENQLLFPSPKSVTLYRSDLDSAQAVGARARLQALFSQMGLPGFSKNPKFKVRPDVMFGDFGKKPCPISNVIFAMRTATDNASLVATHPEEVATRATFATLRELKPLMELLYMFGANAPSAYAYPKPIAVETNLFQRYKKAFGKARCFNMFIPEVYPPNAVIETLIDNAILKA